MIGLAFVAFVVCCVLPVAYLLATTLGAARSAYAVVALDSRQQGLLFTTALLGIGTAALATAIGAPLGIVLARVPLRGRGWCVFLRVRPFYCRPISSRSPGSISGGIGYPNGRTAYRPPSSF